MRYRPSRRLIIATSVIATLAVAFILLLPEIVCRRAIDRLGSVLTVPVSIADAVVESDIEALKQTVFWGRIPAAKGKNYQPALVDVYKSFGGITDPGMPLSAIAEASLERFAMERITIPRKEIIQLARNRAELVRRELIKQGVDPDRLATTAQAEPAADAAPEVNIELVS